MQVYAGTSFLMDRKGIAYADALYGTYSRELTAEIMPLMALFWLVLMILSFLLWRVLRRLQFKNTQRIAEQLRAFQNTKTIMTDNPALASAYESIQETFSNHWKDYERFHAYLTHEQKNILAILRTQIGLNGNKEQLASVDQLTDNLDDILTLSEFNDQHSTGTVDISLICADICDSYRKLNFPIHFHFDPDDSTLIIAKERWIYRAITNLVSNAIKYGKDKPIDITVRNQNNSVIVIVKDYGIGMSKIEQEMIFQHRYRINDLHKAGHGIGLSLVAHVSDLCGGFVTVESEPGKGSTFYLAFPHQ